MLRCTLVFLMLGFLFAGRLVAQFGSYDQELAIANENDVYVLKNTDRYYSNGILFHFRFEPDSSSFFGTRKKKLVKRLVDFELTQKFFTPRDLTLRNVDDFDRPYAGWLYAGFTVADFPKSNTRLEYGLEIGAVGEASGAGAFQTWYHKNFGFPEPRGWSYQIPSELVLNLKAELNHQWSLIDGQLDLISSTRVMLGSAFTNGIQRLDLRIGRLYPLSESGFVNAIIGHREKDLLNHFYFFTGYGYQWTLHDITIQGSIWNNNSPHTESIFSGVRHFRMGWAASSSNSTFRMTYNWLSKEVKGAKTHSYIGFELLLRFVSN